MYQSREKKAEELRQALKEKYQIKPPGRPKKTIGLPNVAAKRQHYDAQLREQNNICPICLFKLSDNRRQRHNDHCHISNRLRGVLCVSCNILLGNAKDDIKLLQRAIKYLEKHRELRIPVDPETNEPVRENLNVHPSWNLPFVPAPIPERPYGWWHILIQEEWTPLDLASS